ncbi:asparaginase [Dellaglioa algida]|uniref:asparaginase n=1 Tax=Dellaglioa algida TaxID=105612 RepID=A0A2C8ES62_9LACO|nr:asparaginase [Dellaglioa algida]MDK1717169.1 asparaginase [Dellaglioa algida]MDK1718750.1 asparaginase [Dellaglioa algida]MDK1720364.1 asparaginase [Dellaglioa algida]MDK1722111.1 asparaginase [Dellaglioa algida]MDK1723771.1 asparaginase [Dellaglioa algida]
MKKILILHTGGTIAMSENQETGAIAPGAENPLNQAVNPFGDRFDLITENVFNLPSPHIGPKEMLIIQKRIMLAFNENIDGVVITHGTDTLEETAYFLDLTLPNHLPVVLTGAMRSANEIGSDGLHNFQTAILTAASDDAVDKGVLVVMNDEIHTARYVTKTHTTNVATFRTPTFGPIGSIAKDSVNFFAELLSQTCLAIDEVVDHVYLVKAYAGMDAELLGFLDNDQTNGVVIEALGAGNLPPQVLENLQKLIDRDIPVVIVSRCFNGVAQDVYDYEGGGVQLKKMGGIFCRGLNGQKARIKLLVGLSTGLQKDELAIYVADALS